MKNKKMKPLKSQSSKRKLIVIATAFTGLMLLFFAIVLTLQHQDQIKQFGTASQPPSNQNPQQSIEQLRKIFPTPEGRLSQFLREKKWDEFEKAIRENNEQKMDSEISQVNFIVDTSNPSAEDEKHIALALIEWQKQHPKALPHTLNVISKILGKLNPDKALREKISGVFNSQKHIRNSDKRWIEVCSQWQPYPKSALKELKRLYTADPVHNRREFDYYFQKIKDPAAREVLGRLIIQSPNNIAANQTTQTPRVPQSVKPSPKKSNR